MSTIIAAYREHQGDYAKYRKEIIETYASIVKRIAYHLMGRLPKTVQIEDLIQAGMIGLLEAAENYDATKGASFETYAGIRIRGNMLDEVRKNDWVPRSVYRNSRRITQAVQIVENANGRDAKDHEVATELGVSLNEYHSMLRDTASAQVYGYDDVGLDEDIISEGCSAALIGPMEGVQREQFQTKLAIAIDQLPDREKLVLSLYYDEELNLKEIGHILEVSESRVCQIHSQAMHRLKARFSDWKND